MDIFVYSDWIENQNPLLIGYLRSSFVRGKDFFSFEYNDEWLKSPCCQEIDPDLSLYSGLQYLRNEKTNFGVFSDSSPDRWGRLLMDRRENILAKQQNRARQFLSESDYLLGVYDQQRMGGLRFKTDINGCFLNNDEHLATPPITAIRELEQASYNIENSTNSNSKQMQRWLNMILAPGSSLGGARPKAGIINTDNALWIAKFPSSSDTYDIGLWEKVVNELAKKSGINVAIANAKKFSGKYHTFLTKRFDRTVNAKRIHFASAMTLLGYNDGMSFLDGVSYLEIAEFIIRKGAKVEEDLRELFKRIVFSICVGNSDDHLRNHGFLLTNKGWILSPAFDINPNPKATGLKLNITEKDNALNLDLALEIVPYFRISGQYANEIIEKIKTVVGAWRKVATSCKVSREEQEMFAPAFFAAKAR
jgi:serine/threonine-protein kinase HipA